ncbi:hypothetical protein [Streptomyces sp. NRRL WC-3549]|uniref:hypothetical protein n=1 Tax=Streptomyces sp. NRRL WC-3549 TaxID=1463925 RepID=UPI00068D30AB|nr:hypothetical protein [Streptomyces sp. NRRL WC-3549]
MVMMSAQGRLVTDITLLLQVGADYVRHVIHASNERGSEDLDPNGSGGRPRMVSSQVREHICLIARMYYRIRPRKRWREFLALLKSLRTRWPSEKQRVVLDNFSRTSTLMSGPGLRRTTSIWSSCRPTDRG